MLYSILYSTFPGEWGEWVLAVDALASVLGQGDSIELLVPGMVDPAALAVVMLSPATVGDPPVSVGILSMGTRLSPYLSVVVFFSFLIFSFLMLHVSHRESISHQAGYDRGTPVGGP